MRQFDLKSLFLLTACFAAIFCCYACYIRLNPPGPFVNCQKGINDVEYEQVIGWTLKAVKQRAAWDIQDSHVRIMRIDDHWGVTVMLNPPTPGAGASMEFNKAGRLLYYSPTL